MDNLDYGTLMDVFPEDDCTDLNQLGACMKKAICFFVRTAAEADLYPKHCDGVLFFRKSMIINWQYLDVYIIYVCFLPPLLPMCSNFYLTCLLLLVTEVM